MDIANRGKGSMLILFASGSSDPLRLHVSNLMWRNLRKLWVVLLGRQ